MKLSPRLRAPMSMAPRLPAGAIVPVLATCALTAGIGVGILYTAANVGGRAPEAPAPREIVVVRTDPAPIPPSVPGSDVAPAAVVPPVAQVPIVAAPEPSPPIVLDPLMVAQIRVDAEAPFTVIPPRPIVAPVSAPPAAPQSAVGQMVKVIPSSDGLPARLRARPNTTSQIVARIPAGTALRVLGRADGARDWLRVSWNGATAYVFAELVR